MKQEKEKELTVLLPKFRTLQLKYADLPTNAVTFFWIIASKYGSDILEPLITLLLLLLLPLLLLVLLLLLNGVVESISIKEL